jgi:hypothetical protein
LVPTLLIRFSVAFLAFGFAYFIYIGNGWSISTDPTAPGISEALAYMLVAGISVFLNYCFWHRIPGPIIGGVLGTLIIAVWNRDFLACLGLTAGATIAVLLYQTAHRELGPMEMS